jgi:hypothetical protein
MDETKKSVIDEIEKDILLRLEKRFHSFSGVTLELDGADWTIVVNPEAYTEIGFECLCYHVNNIILDGDY